MGRLGLISFALLGCAGCASTSGLELEMSKMRRDLAAMQKELKDTQLAVQRLEGQVTILSLDHRDDVQRAPTTEVASAPKDERRIAGATSKAASPEVAAKRSAQSNRVLPVVRLGQKAETAPKEVDPAWVDPGAQDDGSPPIVIQLGADESTKERIAVDHEVLKKPDPVLGKAEATSAQIESEYSAALAKLRAEQKPTEAKAMFEAFRAAHPKSNLADNAMYWAAECDYALKSYAAAIERFQSLIAARPRSQKVPDALIRIGECHAAMGEPAKARPVLQKVIDSYPKTDAANRARAQLEAIAAQGGN